MNLHPTSWRRALGVLLLAATAASAYALAFALRFGEEWQARPDRLLSSTLAWVVAVKTACMVYFRLHEGWTRYVTLPDLVVAAQAVLCATVGITLVDAFLFPEIAIPRSISVLDGGATFLLLTAIRGLPRIVRHARHRLHDPSERVRALIVGANDSGEALLRSLQRNARLRYAPVGFVDDRQRLLGGRIGGVPVLGGLDDIPQLVRQHRIEEVLITAGELPGRAVRDLIDQASAGEFRVKVLPSYEQLLHEKVAITPRSVAITDLLRRPSIEIDDAEMRSWLRGKTVLVTGAAGSIGAEICRQVLRLEIGRLVAVDRSETGQFYLERELQSLESRVKSTIVMADLTDNAKMAAVFAEHRPDVLFHAAAYKHVPLMEANPGEAVKNIVLATRDLADLAEEHDVESFVMISTDKAVNPTSVMGSCKRLAEDYVQAKGQSSRCRFATVRFGNVLDSAGSVVPIFREQIAQGGPVTITHPDIVRYFMLVSEASQLVIQAGAMGQGGETFVLDMGEPVRILDLAHDMIRLSGLRVGDDVEVRIVGLRPGEKLYEELFDDGEQKRPTPHPKIRVAIKPQHNLLETVRQINRLEQVANRPAAIVLQALRSIVPVYRALEETATQPPLRRAA